MENFEIQKRIEQQEKKEKFDDLIIFTTTFYKEDDTSKIREKLALKFFENADKLEIKTVVIDGGSNSSFLNKLEEYENIKLVQKTDLSMGESRRHALNEAIKISQNNTPTNYLWAEPEKWSLLCENNISDMINILRKGNADIVVPERKNKNSMPKFQSWIESRANKKASDKLDKIYDLWFGPKMFNKAGAQYFLNYKSDLDKWDSIIKPVINAYSDNKKISSVPVSFDYDESEKLYEENNRELKQKRLNQYSSILAEIGDSFWSKKIKNNKQ